MKPGEKFEEKCWIVNGDSETASWGLNLSGLFTLLIKTAGEECLGYASDLLYDIDEMKADLRNAESFRKSKRYSNGPDGTERLTYALGFRDYGVDHKEWIDVRLTGYKEIVEITFELGRGFVLVRAERVGEGAA